MEIDPNNAFALECYENVGYYRGRMDFRNYHCNTDWNMDDNEYWDCDIEKFENYWDRDVSFLSNDEANVRSTKPTCEEWNNICVEVICYDKNWCQPCNSNHLKK